MDITSREGHEALIKGPIKELLTNLAKEGKLRPRIILFNATTVLTREMPPIVFDDHPGQPYFKAVISLFDTLEAFADSCPYPEAVERVRQGLAKYPDDMCVCTMNDERLTIKNVEVTTTLGSSQFTGRVGIASQSEYAALGQKREVLDAQVAEVFATCGREMHEKVDGAAAHFRDALERLDGEWGHLAAVAACYAHLAEIEVYRRGHREQFEEWDRSLKEWNRDAELRGIVEVAVEKYGYKKDAEQEEAQEMIAKAFVHFHAENVVKSRGKCPTVMIFSPQSVDFLDIIVANFQTIEEFESIRPKAADQRRRTAIRLQQVRDALRANPESFAVCTYAAENASARESQSGWTVWAVDKRSMLGKKT